MSLKPWAALLAFATALALSSGALAQQPAPSPRPAAYQVQFFLSESQSGKTAVVHTYTLCLMADASGNSIQVGRRVPVAAGSDKFDYESVGLRLDCSLPLQNRQLAPGQLGLRVHLDLSSLVPNTSPDAPTIQSTVADVETAVPLGQRVSVSRFQDVDASHAYELEVLATAVGPAPAAPAPAPAAPR